MSICILSYVLSALQYFIIRFNSFQIKICITEDAGSIPDSCHVAVTTSRAVLNIKAMITFNFSPSSAPLKQSASRLASIQPALESQGKALIAVKSNLQNLIKLFRSKTKYTRYVTEELGHALLSSATQSTVPKRHVENYFTK
jgi:hypothetical protein